MPETMPTQLEEALGTYIGPASREEVIEALGEHTFRDLVLHVALPDGSPVVHTSGTLSQEDDAPPEVFAIGGRQSRAAFEAGRYAVEDPSARLSVPSTFDGADRYVGGAVLRLAGGVTITLVLWHGVLHLTESGDVAPGMGPVDVNLVVEEEED